MTKSRTSVCLCVCDLVLCGVCVCVCVYCDTHTHKYTHTHTYMQQIYHAAEAGDVQTVRELRQRQMTGDTTNTPINIAEATGAHARSSLPSACSRCPTDLERYVLTWLMGGVYGTTNEMWSVCGAPTYRHTPSRRPPRAPFFCCLFTFRCPPLSLSVPRTHPGSRHPQSMY